MRTLMIALILTLAATNASAQWLESLNTSTIYWENDNFGLGRKSDRFYTNGVRYTAGFSDNVIEWRWPKTLRDSVWRHAGISGDEPIESVGVVFGQNFYTPQNLLDPAPQPRDRPWAGVLYGGLTEAITNADQTLSHSFELQAGILGQGAGAQRTQKYVHNDLGFSSNDPQGWPNQLRNEPVLALLYQQMRRYPIRKEVLDVIPSGGVLLGSPVTNATLGATMRLGYHVSGLPVTTIANAAASTRLTAPHVFEAYVFAGGEGRFVPFNATIEGGLFNDGPKAPGPKKFVRDLRGGLSVRWRWARLTYMVIDRSAEFDVPAGAIESQRFGSFAFAIEPFDRFRED